MGGLFSMLELLGTVAFAVSGAMIAIDRHADLFGVVFLGMTTAIGGGMVRDCLLGSVPPAIFFNRPLLLTAAVCPLLVFVVAAAAGRQYQRNKALVDIINNLVDALGLGAFTVTGVRMGLAAGYTDQWFLLVFLGLLTGIGGGVLRDVMTDCVPIVLTRHVYALASIGGALEYLLLYRAGVDGTVAGMLVVTVVFCVRLLATVFHWNLPRISGPAAEPAPLKTARPGQDAGPKP